jgi:hypothetical protein
MRPRWAARLAWVLWALTLTVFVFAMAFGATGSIEDWTQVSVLVTYAAFLLAFSTVGALIASRRARNPIGWILLGSAMSYAIGGLTEVPAGSLPGVPHALHDWLGTWVWGVGISLAGTFLLLLFPGGELPSRRWRPVAWAAGVGLVAFVLGQALAPELAESHTRNPAGIGGAVGQVFELLQEGILLVVGATLASIASLVMRFRRAADEERHQLKWLTYAAGLVALALVGASLVNVFSEPSDASDNIQNTLVTGALACVPIAIGIAILRYRLYDIDRIINRTLVYGILTALLAAVYAGVAVGLGTVVGESSLVVAASTLLVAALFRPARGRVQGLIDRRFYRQKYDAARTVEAFAARLREEVDLDSLTGDLVGVVRDTMQPANASLWLRSPEARP